MQLLTIPLCLTACWLPAQSATLPNIPQGLNHVQGKTGGAPATPAAIARTAATQHEKVLFDRPQGDELWARGKNWKASFDTGSWTYVPFFGAQAPRNFPIIVDLQQVSVGGVPLELHPIAPELVERAVHLDYGSVVERLDPTVDAIEQSFVFSTLPKARGEIAVDIAFSTELDLRATDRGITFSNDHGAVTYEKAVAIDANGLRLSLTIELTDNCAHIVIPEEFVARATLPLVLDPVFNGVLYTTPNVPIIHLDTATLQQPDQTVLVYQQPWSATDQDCYAVGYSRDLSQVVFGPVAVDYTSSSWSVPHVASNANSRQYLVVGEFDTITSTVPSVVGRLVDDAGMQQPRFLIDTGGSSVPGLGGAYKPVVGGDPYPTAQAYFTVAYTSFSLVSQTDVYMRQVDQAGNLRGNARTPIDVSVGSQSAPSISKSNKTSDWRLAYVSSTTTSSSIIGVNINWNGSISNTGYTIATSSMELDRPSCSTPATSFDTTQELGLVTYEAEQQQSINTTRNVLAAVVDGNGNVTTTLDISALMPTNFDDQRKPICDSDGTRFAVTFHQDTVYGEAVYVMALQIDQGTGQLQVVEAPDLLDFDSLADSNNRSPITSYFSGGNEFSTSYSHAMMGSPSGMLAQLREYRGHTPGTLFELRSTECGTLPITATGNPVIGDTVTISAQATLPSGTFFGFPGSLNLSFLGCPCTIGVDQSIASPNPLVWTVPNNTAFVGFQLSVQGWEISGSNCLSLFDVSDTVDFEIR